MIPSFDYVACDDVMVISSDSNTYPMLKGWKKCYELQMEARANDGKK